MVEKSVKKGLITYLFGFILLIGILNSTLVYSEPISSNPLIPIDSGLYRFRSPIVNYYKYGEFFSSIELLRDWSSKSFTNTTLMFIGGGIGFLPFMNMTIRLWSYYPGCPGKVNVYVDGEFYDTIYSFWHGGPICVRMYDLHYYLKGFHSLTFVAADNSTTLNIDVQIGPIGFTQHILPNLI